MKNAAQNIETKIKANFFAVYGFEATNISTKEDIGYVRDSSALYSCRLTARGVKKNSWSREDRAEF